MPGRIRDPGPTVTRAGLGQALSDPPAPAQDSAGAGSARAPRADGEPGPEAGESSAGTSSADDSPGPERT